ncbi:DUF547 domain-containing protein [Patiriisocius sp. Uisw_017]|jgi:hypothetical protein|uniref:DUF547 domain-containing protein n=1 Tax=Patiriisocius sp. Uisw_017 TaxID=3230968 RepID=UPI0039ECF7DB
MKNLYFLIAVAVLLAGCSSTKNPNGKTSKFDESIVINDRMKLLEKRMDALNNPPKIEEENETKKQPQKGTQVKSENKTTTENNVTDIHKQFDILLKQNVSATGNVNYAGFNVTRKTLLNYITSLGENLPTEKWSKNEKLSYWLNAYNAITIDLILRNWPLESIKDIQNPWEQKYWKLGEKYYNLDEIEHKILRKMEDARIHFGINCASFSCPPLLNEAFVSEKVDNQLTFLSKRFINDTSRNKITPDQVEISKIFNWFSKDFKTTGSIIDYLNTYSEVKINNNARVKYMDYDWRLNN